MIQRDPHKGLFITLEGIEGTGKSTHAAALEARVRGEGVRVLQTREPGGTPLGESVRNLVLRSHDPGPEAELFLMLAARADHVERVLVPQLNRGLVVICDRFLHATLAYQGGGRGLESGEVERAGRLATGGLVPDLTLLLDASQEELEQRMARRASRGDLDRIDRERVDFFKRVRNRYFELAEGDSRMVVIPTGADRDRVAEEIWKVVQPAVAECKQRGSLD